LFEADGGIRDPCGWLEFGRVGCRAVAQWLRCCATIRKVAGSIPDGVIGILH
jgi:hypothetical protein